MVKLVVYEDLWFVVKAEPKDYMVDFTIYDVDGFDEDGNPLLHRKGSGSYPDPVEGVDNADIFAHGEVKWDGCSNWHFDEQDRLMIHGCSREHLSRLGEVLARCWDMTAELIPNWIG